VVAVSFTTLTINMVQGYAITWFDVIGTLFIIASLISYYLITRASQKKPSTAYLKPVRGKWSEGVL
jgi:hypothetical protein